MDEKTKEELLDEARELDVEGRSKMNKDELDQAVEQVRENLPDPELVADAQAIDAWLTDNSDDHHVDDISAGTGIDPDRVREILDEWVPDAAEEDGVRHVGPGQGGPWVIVPGFDESELPEG